jgi:hypothetical protein
MAVSWIGKLWPTAAAGGVITPELYLSLMTMHGTLMVFFVLTTVPQSGFGNYFLPIQIGAEDMAFPVLNMMSFWTTFLALVVMVAAFFTVKDNRFVRAMLTAVRPVVVGLLLWTAYDMARAVFGAGRVGWLSALSSRWDGVLLALASFAVLTFTSVNPVWVILGAAMLGLVVYR